MKVWISFDMEGVAGIVDWEQCRAGGDGYARGCELTLAEVNAAIRGAVAGGATQIVVNDSHSRMQNLDPAALEAHATYISGRHKPMYMMQGLDATFDAAFLIGYHGSISGEPSVLSHSYNPEVFTCAAVNGIECGESGINALVNQHFGVPTMFVSSDRVAHEQTAPFAPDAVMVETKTSITRFAASNLHPELSRERIEEGARVAMGKVAAGVTGLPGLPSPSQLDLEFHTSDQAEVATWAKGAERLGTRSVRIESDDLLAMFRSFVAVNYITRQAGGR
jgi:D-amino peptidase